MLQSVPHPGVGVNFGPSSPRTRQSQMLKC
jgi:hypothetical protein